MGTSPPRPAALWVLTQGATPSKPLMGFQARSSGSHWDFPLTSPNRELYLKYQQGLAQNDTTLLPFVGVNKILPSSPAPQLGVMQDMGWGMPPGWGPSGSFAPLNGLEKEASSRWEQRWGAAPWGDSRPGHGAALQGTAPKTFTELFSKCTEGCVYPAAHNCFFGRIPNT